MVTDLLPGPLDSDPMYLINLNGDLVFSATDDLHGRELWILETKRPAAE